MSKVVLAAIHSKYIHSALAPWCLAAAVEEYCLFPHQVLVREGTINQPDEKLLELLTGDAPQVLGLSCYIWNWTAIRRLLPRLRQCLPDTVLVAGGPEVSFCSRQVMEDCPEIDYVISGEGERPFSLLMDRLAAGKDVGDIPGLSFRRDGRPVILPSASSWEIHPSPYTPAYFAALGNRIPYMETSRGCPFSCAFCLSGREDPVRFYPMERAQKELLALAATGARTIKLVDRTFNCNAARTKELLEFILAHWGKEIPKGVCFHFEVGADLFDEETLALLSTAPKGLFQMEAGLQSFHPQTLAAVSRVTDMKRLERNLRTLIAMGNCHIHIDLIAGLPDEDLETFGRSFDLAFALRPQMLQLGFLKLIHGSRLRQMAPELGYRWDPQPPYECLDNPWFHPANRQALHRCEDALERLWNSGRFCLTVEYLLESTGLRPFELFCRFGDFAAAGGDLTGIRLDEYTALLWKWGKDQPGVEMETLRDHLLCDRLRRDNTGRIPPCIHRPDPRVGEVKRLLRESLDLSGCDGAGFGAAILSDGQTAVALYRDKDPVTGNYPFVLCSREQLEKGPIF